MAPVLGISVHNGRVWAAYTEAPGQAEAAYILGQYPHISAAIAAAPPVSEIVVVYPAHWDSPDAHVVITDEEVHLTTDLEVLDGSIPRRVVVVDVAEKKLASFGEGGEVMAGSFSRSALSDAVRPAPFHSTVCLVHPSQEQLSDEYVVITQDYNTVIVDRSSVAAWALDLHGRPVEDAAGHSADGGDGGNKPQRRGLLRKLFGR